MFARGELDPSTPLRSEPEQNWVAARDVAEFFPQPPPLPLAATTEFNLTEPPGLLQQLPAATVTTLPHRISPATKVRDKLVAKVSYGGTAGGGGVRWLIGAALFTSFIAVIAVVVLAIVIITARSTKNLQREQARVRVAELREEIAQNLAQRKAESAEAHLNELIVLAASFSGLLETKIVDELRQNIRQHAGRWKAEESFAAAQKALAQQQLAVFVDQIRAYLQEPYATEIVQAKSLLADAELILAKESSDDALVAAWPDEDLAEYLRSRKLPPPIVIANAALRDIYQARLHDLALRESERRAELVKRERERAARVEKEREDRRKKDEERLRLDKEQAERILREEKRKLLDAEKKEWLAHPERHGILALIPQDAIGGISVAGMSKMHEIINDAERDFGENGRFLALFGRIVLASRPFDSYQPDQPLALVFANPVKAGFELKGDPFNPLAAMWDRAVLESLGVVVGTPIAVADVERKLTLPAGSLAGEKMQHTRLPYLGEMKTVSVLLRDKQLYVGFTDLAVHSVADALRAKKSLAGELAAQEGARLASMDALLHFGPGTWKEGWDAIAAQVRAGLAADKEDKEAVELADHFATLMRRASTFLLGFKLDKDKPDKKKRSKGLETSLLVLLSPHDDARLDRFQVLLGEGDAPLTLNGLPHDGATIAFATRGNGTSNALIAQSLFLLPLGPVVLPGVEIPHDKRITLARAFREVWNQVQRTRAAAYSPPADSVVVMLDTSDPAKFIDRLTELVNVWDKVSVELAGGDELKSLYRFALSEEVFDGRKAYRLSLTQRAAGVMHEWKLQIVPIEKQMVLFFGKDEIQLSQAIKNVTAEVPRRGLAEHPGILESEKRLPAARKMEIHLWLSEIMKLPADKELAGAGPARYSSASLTLGENSLGVDVWIQAEVIAWILDPLRKW